MAAHSEQARPAHGRAPTILPAHGRAPNPHRQARRWGPKAALAIVAILVLVIAAYLGTRGCSPSPKSGTLASPFEASSPWRQPIQPNPELDPDSGAMIGGVQSKPGIFANLVEFGIPIYSTSADTPTYTVNCTEASYGVCPFAGWPVPIPDDAHENTGSDHVLVTVDESSDVIYEFWRASKKDNTWSTSFAAVNSLRGTGWGGAATGSGASRLAGVIRLDEIEAGYIPHALALQTNNACPTFRSPALKSDGYSKREDCIPEGARLQLDPSIDLTKLGLSKGELAVATAMQRYGGYVMDVADTPLSMSFERDTAAAPGTLGQTYTDAGFRWDYDAMEHIPWEKLVVLK